MKVERVRLVAANGKPIRWVTAVTIPGREQIVFMERLSKAQAVKQAEALVGPCLICAEAGIGARKRESAKADDEYFRSGTRYPGQ